jgi:hypothetical protein
MPGVQLVAAVLEEYAGWQVSPSCAAVVIGGAWTRADGCCAAAAAGGGDA